MKVRFSKMAWPIVLLGYLPVMASAEIPLMINHQGMVQVGGASFEGNGDFRFAFVDKATGQNAWTNDGSQLSQVSAPTTALNLPVINGIYNVRLGDTALPSMVGIPSTLFDASNLALRIWFDDETHGVQQLSPDHVVTSGAYAFHALTAETAVQAANADMLGGQDSSAFAPTDHAHNLQELSGTVTDAQVPDDITVLHAETAGDAETVAGQSPEVLGVPSGYRILGDSPTPPAGYTYTGVMIDWWRPRASLPQTEVGPCSAAVGETIYVIGGSSSTLNLAYDTTADSWTMKAPMPTGRYALGAATVNGVIYVIGGSPSPGSGTLNTNEAYVPGIDAWTSKIPMPTAREGLVVVAVNNIIYAIGGKDSAGNVLGTNEAYDVSTDSWSSKTPMPTPRLGAGADAVSGLIYVIGGFSGNELSTNEAYDPATDAWMTKAPIRRARREFEVVGLNGWLHSLGGSALWGYALDHEVYDPAHDSWFEASPMPTPRSSHVAETVSGAIYVIGGSNSRANEIWMPPFFVHVKD